MKLIEVTFKDLYKKQDKRTGAASVPGTNIKIYLGKGCTGYFKIPVTTDQWRTISIDSNVSCDGCVILDNTHIGDYCSLHYGAIVGRCANLASFTFLSVNSYVPDYCNLSTAGIAIPEKHTLATVLTENGGNLPLSAQADYDVIFMTVDEAGTPHINVGCRCFTLAQANKHWKEESDRELTRAAVKFLFKQYKTAKNSNLLNCNRPKLA